MLLEDRVVIVSGIGPGTGRDIALSAARQGARLAIAARSEGRLAEVGDEVRAAGGRCIEQRTDITSEEDCARLVDETLTEYGRVDVLINNAFHGGSFTAFENDRIDSYREAFEVNTLGSLRLTQGVVPAMKEQGGGSVVMINSMVVREVGPGFSTYAASKAALYAAVQGLARELGGYGIRVNSVLPGYIWGPNVQMGFQLEAKSRDVDPQVVYDEVAARIPLGRIPDSAEIADAVLFFASDLSRAVTGASLDVNGGLTMT